jgi:hypothetical protein
LNQPDQLKLYNYQLVAYFLEKKKNFCNFAFWKCPFTHRLTGKIY